MGFFVALLCRSSHFQRAGIALKQKRLPFSTVVERVDRGEDERLAFGSLVLGVALTDLESGIALTNHVDTTAAAHDLAVGMTVLQSSDGRYDFHSSSDPTYVG
jgi:hypothetical protein